MISYEVFIRDSEEGGLKIPGGRTHKRLAKAKEELQEKKLQFPEAFVAAVEYATRGDGSLGRMVLKPFTPLPWIQQQITQYDHEWKGGSDANSRNTLRDRRRRQ